MAPRTAIILAAGYGRRLGSGGPKCLVPVDGEPILHRAIRNLAAVGVRDVFVVVGHGAEEIIARTGDRLAEISVHYVHSDAAEFTNNAYSLWLARAHLDGDVFVLDGDIAFDPEIPALLAAQAAPAVTAVAPWGAGMNGTGVVLDDGLVVEIVLAGEQPGAAAPPFETVNIHLPRADYLATEFLPRLEALIARGEWNAFYDTVLAETVNQARVPMRAVDCRDIRWQEIDDRTDLAAADWLFMTPADRLNRLNRQHGGYWRHEVTDHSLLYNAHFPSEGLWERLTANLRPALANYPVGQETLCELLAAAIGQPAARLAVANGASELIKILAQLLDDTVLPVPGFHE
ncbi:NTP transferase domain-containing protein [Nocardia sp. NPDC051570]|uniref:NTP transferase domain-containing protein n=1 Tax=Nocardia sp. NPDC051570 TaxID=3364324 RepID=UPI00379BB8B5